MSDSGSTIQFFALQGVTCAGCVRSVKRTVSTLQVAGKIEDFSVNFADRTLVVSGDCPSDEISIALSEAGYGATLLRGEDDREELEQTELAHYRRTLTTSVLALMSGALMMAAMMLGWQPPLDTEAGALGSALQALVSGAVMFFCAGHIYRGAWKSLKTRNFNMDTLIAMGTLSAWGYSAVIAVLSYLAVEELPSSAQHLYFEAAVMILGFILLGQAIEIKVRGTTAKAVQSLVASQPGTAWRQCEDGQVRAVDIALVVPGDTLLAKPGETIACDGEIIEGRSGVDESLLTGESIAQLKGPGDTIVGGTLNGAAPLHYRVTQVGGNTLMAKMVREVRRAQNSKPPLGVLADSIAAVFVPAVLLITSLTLVLWWWFGPAGYWGYTMMASVSVLIIACPCALGLATPISTMVGVGLAAKRGILIRKGDALQVASKVTTLVLDKTGTLTQGKPSVTDVQWLDECCQNDVLQALQALERPSEHPLARAVLAYTEQHLPGALERQNAEGFESHVGLGVQTQVAGVSIEVGSLHWLGARLNEDQRTLAERWMAQAKTVVLVRRDAELCLMLAIADPLKEDSAEAVAQLQREGIELVILSGDNPLSVQAVARTLNIERYRGALSAADKLAEVQRLQTQGQIVAMVGDGVNDTAALAAANLGCAMGQGSDVAIEHADITLINGSLLSLPRAIALSKRTLRNIKQNLFAAFIYNAVAIPVAAGVFFPVFGLLLNPAVAGLAMALSSISVVANAYRLAVSKIA